MPSGSTKKFTRYKEMTMLTLRSRADYSALENFFRYPQQFESLFIGLDHLMDDFSLVGDLPESKYPPFNLIQEDKNHYIIEMALAGFKSENISVTSKNGWLTISAEAATSDDNEVLPENNTTALVKREYVYRGLASRKFEQEFKLYEYFSVVGADFDNGLLKVKLERKLPDHLKEKKIEISVPKAKSLKS
jgi:molecular chaperone IbpA